MQKAFKVRRGAVTVEFALVAPITFLLIFGLIEFSRVSTIRHSVDNAAYEAARVGIIPGATNTDVHDAASQSLSDTGLIPSMVTVSPFPLNDDSTEVTVTVVVDVAQNSWVEPVFTRNLSLTGEATLGTERYRGFNPSGN